MRPRPRHYAAVALACVPALAYLALFALNQVLPELGKPFAELSPRLQHFVMTITVLSGSGGFIVTSLLWGTTLTHLIDGRVKPAAATLLLAGVCCLVRRDSFTLAIRSHRLPRHRAGPARNRRPCSSGGGAVSLPLGSRLRRHGDRDPCTLAVWPAARHRPDRRLAARMIMLPRHLRSLARSPADPM